MPSWRRSTSRNLSCIQLYNSWSWNCTKPNTTSMAWLKISRCQRRKPNRNLRRSTNTWRLSNTSKMSRARKGISCLRWSTNSKKGSDRTDNLEKSSAPSTTKSSNSNCKCKRIKRWTKPNTNLSSRSSETNCSHPSSSYLTDRLSSRRWIKTCNRSSTIE